MKIIPEAPAGRDRLRASLFEGSPFTWIHHHDGGLAANARDRRDVANEIEIEIIVERRVDRVRRIGQQEGIAVRGRAHDRLGSDVATGTRPVLDDKLLTEPLR